MTKINLEIHDDIISTIAKIRNINDIGIELNIPEHSVLFENILNLKTIKKYCEDLGFNIIFITTDEIGNNLISMLEDEENVGEFSEAEPGPIGIEETNTQIKRRFTFKLPKINFRFSILKFIFMGILSAGIIFLILFIISSQKVWVKIVVNSQPLTRSLTIKIKSGATTDADKKMLRGENISTNADFFAEVETTGEKTVGEKAKGEVIFYNNTDEEKKVKKSTTLKLDDSISFVLDDDITVPQRTEVTPDPLNPSLVTYKKGEAEGKITAADIGESYNIDSDEELSVKGYKKSEVTSFTKDKVEGGESKKVKVVSQEDIDAIKKDTLGQVTQTAKTDLVKKLPNAQALVENSWQASILSETFNNKLGEETEKLTLNQKVTITGLVYNKEDLKNTVAKLVENLIPEGYEISEQEQEIQVDVLGNSTSSVLSFNEADVQVTLKTFIVTEINEEEIKTKLGGKTLKEAEKLLGSINNIKTYEIKITPNLPLLTKIPKNMSKIQVQIERN